MKKIIIALLCISLYCACQENDAPEMVRPEVSYSEFLDVRDSTVYKCITIGDQTWMAENLRYRVGLGPYDGCYTYDEEKVDTGNLVVNARIFGDSVLMAIERNEIRDPEGVAPADGPVKKLKTYVALKNSAKLIIRNMASWPEIVETLNQIYEEVYDVTAYYLTLDELKKTELANGGYAGKYGFLYTHEGALKAIPDGWRLPTDQDWKKLEEYLGMPIEELGRMEEWRGNFQGRLLMEGEEGIGFDAQLGGARLYGSFPYGTPFIDKGTYGFFWAADQIVETDSTSLGIAREIFVYNSQIMRRTSKLSAAYSVRCIKE